VRDGAGETEDHYKTGETAERGGGREILSVWGDKRRRRAMGGRSEKLAVSSSGKRGLAYK